MKQETFKKANELAKEIELVEGYLKSIKIRLDEIKTREEGGELPSNDLRYSDGRNNVMTLHFVDPTDILEMSSLKAEKKLKLLKKEFDKLTD